MILTINNIEKLQNGFVSPANGVVYHFDRIVTQEKEYRFHCKRSHIGIDEVLMITLDRASNPLDGLFTLRIGTTTLGISYADIKHITRFLKEIETVMKIHSLDVNLNNC